MRKGKKQTAIINLNNKLLEVMNWLYSDDETDDDETNNNEQPDSTDMPDLESEKSAEQENQEGQGLKILTPNQMLSRLPITLAQLKAKNNSENL